MAVTWAVSNQGIGTTNRGSWHDQVWLAEDPAGGHLVTRLGSFAHYGHLAVGGGYERTASVSLPNGFEGTYYVVVTTAGPFEFVYTDNNSAVSAALEVGLTLPPDLVVTDIVLEGELSGLGLVRAIRAMQESRGRIPVLALSGLEDLARRIEILRLGANDYITKPINIERLKEEIDHILAETKATSRAKRT